jgi:spermidine synthase
MPEPTSGQTNRFFTREFFEQCRSRLGPGGVLAFRLRMAENVWTPQQTRRAGSIHRALGEVFDTIVTLPGTTHVVLASTGDLPQDPETLCQRFEVRRLRTRLVSPPYIRYLYTNDRFFETQSRLAGVAAPANTDTRPICYQYTLLIWLSKFFPVLAWLDLPEWSAGGLARNPIVWLLGVGALVVLAALRRWSMGRRAMLVAIAGLVGMVLETALILNYQTARGVLYQDLGLLLTLFMAGLALGSAAVAHRASAGSKGSGLSRRLGHGLLWAFALLCLTVSAAIEAGWVTGLVLTGALLLACGVLVAGVLAFASLHGRPEQRQVVSPLYAADLIGGCLGSLAASLFLIPVLGLPGTALLLVFLAAAATLLV